jgi:V/A-type H+-transporting ATPase subunit K
METGYVIAMLSIAFCVLACGVGSCFGLYQTSTTAAGVLSEDPKKFGKVMVLVLLPATQGIYGFIIGIIASSSLAQISSAAEGWAMLGALLPMIISGIFSAIIQGKAAANCIKAVGKQESLSGKLIVYPGMIEFYAILGLIISIMLVPLVGVIV